MKGRTGKSTGGVNDSAKDMDKKNQRYTYQSKVNDEAEERKAGGRTKKMVGDVKGAACKPNAGRKPRKNGGRAGSDSNPFSSARNGTNPVGHKAEAID